MNSSGREKYVSHCVRYGDVNELPANHNIYTKNAAIRKQY